MKLIDKDALVSEIKKKIEYAQTLGDNAVNSSMQQFYDGMKEGCNNLLNSINTLEVKEMRDNYLEKFKSLQHIDEDLKSTLQDWGYTPNLYHFDGSWHVDWIHCEDGDSIKGFTADTPEEAIDKAYNWFHSTFCNG